ncbi:MAG: PTS glucose transporter subunit IIA [Clostridia bacterium]|nr:PTS glucose transporter subunit IIA [Clostridia bacterium]
MLGIFKKNKEIEVFSPMNGTKKELSSVPDKAFSEKMLGDGAAVLPNSKEIYSPVTGVISDITDTKHAFCIVTDDNTEILLHIGINTVNLKGEGFKVFVKANDRISAGEKIAEVDLELLKKHSISLETPVLVMEPEHYEIKQNNVENVCGGKDILFILRKI